MDGEYKVVDYPRLKEAQDDYVQMMELSKMKIYIQVTLSMLTELTASNMNIRFSM